MPRFVPRTPALRVAPGRLVTRAWDRALAREVVVKAGWGPAGDPSPSELHAEYARLLRLRHPRLSPPLDLLHQLPEELEALTPSPPAAGDRAWVLILPWLEGEPLHRARMTDGVRRQVLTDLLGLVGWLHASGLTHLDLKPAHLLLTAEGLRLVDLDRAGPTPTGLEVQLRGTPGYIAPELLLGQESGAAADLFSVGLVMREVLGQPALKMEGATLPAQGRWLSQHGVPPLPREVHAREPVLARLVEALCHVDPARRPVPAEALAQLGGAPLAWRQLTPLPGAPWIGQVDALAALRRQVREVERDKGGVLYLVGQRGSGRSRLLSELAVELSEQGRRVIHLSPEQGSVEPLLVVATLKGLLVGVQGGQGPAEPGVRGAGRGDLGLRRERCVYEAARGLLDAASPHEAKPPLWVLVDDVDGLDELSAAALRRAGGSAAGSGLALVLVGTAEGGREVVTQPWTLREIGAFAEQTLGEEAPPPTELEELRAATGGRPGPVVAALTRRWRQPGAALVTEGEGAPVGALRAEVALAEAERLEVAALSGGEGDPGLLAGLLIEGGAPERARPWLLRALEKSTDQLQLSRAAGLIARLIGTLPESAPLRVELKLRQSELLLALGQAAPAAALAQELLGAGTLPPPAQRLAQARLGRALAALQRYAPAREHLEEAVRGGLAPEEGVRALHVLAWITLRTHDLAAAGGVLEQARALLEPGPSPARVEQLRHEAWLELEAGQAGPATLAALEQGRGMARGLDYRSGELALLQLQAEVHQRGGDLDASRECLLRFVEACRAALDPLREATGLTNLARLESDRGRPAEALALFDRAALLFSRAGRAAAHARCLLSAADLLLDEGQLYLAQARLSAAAPLAQRQGDPGDGTLDWWRASQARLRLLRGDPSAVEEDAAQAQRALALAGQPVLALAAAATRMEALLARGGEGPRLAWRVVSELTDVPRDARSPRAWARLHTLAARVHEALAGEGAAGLPPAPSQGDPAGVSLLRMVRCVRAAEEGEEALAAGLAGLLGAHFGGRGLVWLKVEGGLEVLTGEGFDPDQRRDVSRHVLEEVARSGEALVCPDLRLDERLGAIESLRASRAGSVIAWPVEAQGARVGVLYIDRPLPLDTGPAELRALMEHFAHLCADLLAHLQRRRREEHDAPAEFEGLIGTSAAMKALRRKVAAIVRARSEVIFLDGETGTGKTSLAQLLHRYGHRAAQPMVEADILSAPEGTFDSQLFGHRRGAFTGAISDHVGWLEAAHGGTLFIDEIGELPLSLQKKLLKALEEKRITRVGESRPRPADFVLITATNRDLVHEVKEGRFREDLLYRIRTNTIHVPPLRVRGPEDIRALCEHFLKGHGVVGVEEGFEPEAVEYLLYRCAWPGNVRQLRRLFQVAEVANHLADGERITRDLLEPLLGGDEAPQGDGLPPPGMTLEALKSWWYELRHRYVVREIQLAGGNVSEAARRMGGMQHRTHLIAIRDGKEKEG